ncbi:MAG: HAMP domain-containing sensor histidine kinase [Janthinobacterium lividum]
MTPARLAPRSLTGQLLLLVATALFVAQAINFTLLLGERRTQRLEQAVGPAVARLTDAVEREAAGRPIRADRGRVRRAVADPIAAGLPRRPEVAAGVARALTEAGFRPGRIDTGVRRIDPAEPWLRNLPPDVAARLRRSGTEIQIAVEQPGRGWLVQSAPWTRFDGGLVWRLAGQTLILYVVVLLPMLWIARRIARPLRDLADAARAFAPGGQAEPLAEAGPPDVRALIAAFNALRLRVTAMLEEKDRMLGAIGHDLRTPLAALRVRIESVEDETDRARMADTIAEMSRTLDDILSLARLGRPSEPMTDVDLAALVDAVVEDFRDLGCEVTFDPADRLTMRLRPSLMRRAVRNLIENAVKYGGCATVTLAHDAQAVAIVVADTGAGIPEDRLTAVFDPFTRLEGSRNRDTGGIGLGLALAQAIVRDAGGDVRLSNRAEGGLSATITLPRTARLDA